jgi:CheY-like chemotaxis protein
VVPVRNLAVNAKDAMPAGGKLDFHSSTTTLDMEFCRSHVNISPGEYCHLSISDTGQGISKENIDHIFEPFFTDKDNGKGTGMGLAMVYGVVQNHGGVITVSSIPGEGTRFDVYLPYSGEMDAEVPTESLTLKKGAGKILVIDDEDIIRNLATIMLGRLGYEVVTAENGIRGISLYRQQWQKISLVIVDMVMPEMDGLDCLIALKGINPDLKAILATGYSRESFSQNMYQEYAQGFLEKPFRLKDLALAIEALI